MHQLNYRFSQIINHFVFPLGYLYCNNYLYLSFSKGTIHLIKKFVMPRQRSALQKYSTCDNCTHPLLFLVSNFKLFLQRSFQCHVTWFSALYNYYLIKYQNIYTVCGLSKIKCDEHCRTINTKINNRCKQLKTLRSHLFCNCWKEIFSLE